jgi:hypothetical protein
MKKLTSILCALVIALSATAAPRVAAPVIEKQATKEFVKTLGLKLEKTDAKPSVNRAPSAASDAALATGTYYTTGGKFLVYSSSWVDATSYMPSIQVTVNGNNVTITGLAYYFDEGAIQGTMDGNTITFANGQLLGSDSYGDEYLVGSNDGSTLAENIVFVYDPATNTLTSQTAMLVESASATELSAYAYWTNPVFSGEKPAAPEGGTFVADDLSSSYNSTYGQRYYSFILSSISATVTLWIDVDATTQDVVSGQTYTLADFDADYCYITANNQKIHFTSLQFTKTVAADGSYTIVLVIVDENSKTWNITYSKEGDKLVVLPEGATVVEYTMEFTKSGSADAKPINVAVVGNQVYFQGMSSYLPEAWVVGTKEGNTVTFAKKQYMGDLGTTGSSYFFYNGNAEFIYDAEADTYTAEGQMYGVLAEKYYDGNYTDPVLSKSIEPDFDHPIEVVATKMSFTPYNSSYGDVIYELSNATADTIFSFDIYVYLYETTDVIAGQTYTMADMETSSTYTYVQIDGNNTGLKQVSFVKTFNVEGRAHIEATIVDNKVNVYHLVFDQPEPVVTNLTMTAVETTKGNGFIRYKLSNDDYKFFFKITLDSEDVESGKTYTFADDMGGNTNSSYGVDNSYNYIDFASATFVKTVSASQIKIEASIVDVNSDIWNLTYTEALEPTAVEAVKAQGNAIKRIVNGQVVIEKNGVRYNLLGSEIK